MLKVEFNFPSLPRTQALKYFPVCQLPRLCLQKISASFKNKDKNTHFSKYIPSIIYPL